MRPALAIKRLERAAEKRGRSAASRYADARNGDVSNVGVFLCTFVEQIQQMPMRF
jgi:hypothetical protein